MNYKRKKPRIISRARGGYDKGHNRGEAPGWWVRQYDNRPARDRGSIYPRDDLQA